MELVTVSKSRGNYDWFNPDNQDICYKFNGIPKEIAYPSVVVSDVYELDLEVPDGGGYSPLMFAQDLLEAIGKYYLIFTAREGLEKIIKYLSDNEEEQSKLYFENEYNSLVLKEKELSRNLEKIREIIKGYNIQKSLTKNE